RALLAGPAVFGLAVAPGAGGSELVAEPDIVEKAGDLLLGLAALRAAGDQVRHGGEPIELDPAPRPAMLVGLLGEREIARRHMDPLLLMDMQHPPVGALDRADVAFRQRERAQGQARV